jgi:hypothetical protein
MFAQYQSAHKSMNMDVEQPLVNLPINHGYLLYVIFAAYKCNICSL